MSPFRELKYAEDVCMHTTFSVHKLYSKNLITGYSLNSLINLNVAIKRLKEKRGVIFVFQIFW